jgi:hypothetical protein
MKGVRNADQGQIYQRGYKNHRAGRITMSDKDYFNDEMIAEARENEPTDDELAEQRREQWLEDQEIADAQRGQY